MKLRQTIALGLAFSMALAATPTTLVAGGQQNVTIGGTAKKEAKKPYTDYTVRARNSQGGQIAGMGMLDTNAQFSLAGMPPANYLVELLDKNGKVVCTEGPFNLTQQLVKNDVKIDCGKLPVAWLLIAAAAAAGITAGVVAAGPASPAQ